MAYAMKEATEIVKEAITMVAPYLFTGVKGIVNEASKELWTKIKTAFKSRGDESIATQFEASPLDQNLIGKMEYILEHEIKTNHELAAILSDLVNKIHSSEEHKNQVIQNGDQNISVTDIHNSSVKITRLEIMMNETTPFRRKLTHCFGAN